MDVEDAAVLLIQDFLPGRVGSREGVHRDPLEVAYFFQLEQGSRVFPAVGFKLVNDVAHGEQVLLQRRLPRFRGSAGKRRLGQHDENACDGDNNHELHNREAPLASLWEPCHKVAAFFLNPFPRLSGWRRPGARPPVHPLQPKSNGSPGPYTGRGARTGGLVGDRTRVTTPSPRPPVPAGSLVRSDSASPGIHSSVFPPPVSPRSPSPDACGPDDPTR